MLEKYLFSKRNAWSPVTIKKVRSMLLAYGGDILSLPPDEFFEKTSHLGGYSRKTLFVWAGGYYGFAFPEKENIYLTYRKDNRNAFKNVYQKKSPSISYEEAKARLEVHPEKAFREKALALLGSAQRWTESLHRDDVYIQHIRGKGGKQRSNLSAFVKADAIPYHTFRRRLQECCGVSPHDLRKLALSRAAANGATAADLCAIAGWSSIAPAYYYLVPKDNERLKELLK